MHQVLIIEDDEQIRWNLRELLEREYTIWEADRAESAWDILHTQPIDLCLVDINLPTMNGYELCSQIRAQYLMPIIFVTVLDDEGSIVRGLSCGGDDYITKPFSAQILRVRMAAQLRRRSYQTERNAGQIAVDGYLLDLDRHTLSVNGSEIDLTKTEYEILHLLIKRAGCLVTRRLLLESIWDGYENYVENNTLSVHMSRLRKKLNRLGSCPIETVSGVGYRWERRRAG